MESRNPLFSSSYLEWRDFCCCNTNGYCETTMDGLGKVSSYDDVMGLKLLTGLRLGKHREYGDHCFPQTPSAGAGGKAVKPHPPTGKRSRARASYQNMQNSSCQVEDCNLDLMLAKDYHRRHRICEAHSKSPKVIVAGMERRFCQQCSRFHELSEFDDKKRSCRRRLSDHNARRRRVQPESIHLSPSSSPAVYGVSNSYERPQNLRLSGLPISMNASNPEKWLQIAWKTTASAPDLVSAHSLLSSNTWSLNEGESYSSSMHTTENYDSVVVPQHPNLSLFESLQAGHRTVSLLNPINENSHLQGFHLFYNSERFL